MMRPFRPDSRRAAVLRCRIPLRTPRWISGWVALKASSAAFLSPAAIAAAVPAGPHKGFGGTIDGVIACAGCTVTPGDIVLGDDDGIAVVPLGRAEAVLADCHAKLAQEEESLQRLSQGTLLADQMGIPEPEVVE